jgi:NADH-quinone oxidoreductase subunit G
MPNLIKCTINGLEVEVASGTSIIEAMHKHEQHIAHYCWHPGLTVAGVCRLCMVEIEGNPKVQIACNTQVTEGMKINNTSEKVKDAVKWGLDFHLINHPLDCPICDQAGECGLQDQYMEYGKYTPEMAERKVKKHKVVDLGPTVVLDTERCILCSRCVRFTDEVSKTNELGIFNRGDRAEVGTFAGRPLDNKYSVNTVDICPVGALTSKDFRFRQRVWLLKDAPSVCPGCSTGCSVRIYHNKEGVFRVKPVYNEKVNGHWMCDEGRDVYKFINREFRLQDARVSNGDHIEFMMPLEAAKRVGEHLSAAAKGSAALVITGQYTVEEIDAMVATFKTDFASTRIYHWLNNPEMVDQFDGILNRGDKNPNTKGLQQVFAKYGIQTKWQDLASSLASGEIQTLVVAGPENQAVYPDMAEKIAVFSKARKLVWLSACRSDLLDALTGDIVQIPIKTFFEKNGTFVNFAGLEQKIQAGTLVIAHALTLNEAADIFAGRSFDAAVDQGVVESRRVKNEFTSVRGAL